MPSKISTWNNQQGSRGRSALAVLVTPDGNVHQFRGESIPQVCHSVVTDREKKGAWSNCTFAITHNDQTKFVSWRQDWDTGRDWPGLSWETNIAWLQALAPQATEVGFRAYIAREHPKVRTRLDEFYIAVGEFDLPAVPVIPEIPMEIPAVSGFRNTVM